jgi:hypothetical protein
MSEVDDNRAVKGKIFKTLDLAENFDDWRAVAGVLTGAICRERAVKIRSPEIRPSLETGALLEGASSVNPRTDCGASL